MVSNGNGSDPQPPTPEPEPGEPYEMDKTEFWQVKYLDERIGRLRAEIARAQAELTPLQETQRTFLQQLGSKYSVDGKYDLLGSVDGSTGIGRRQLKEIPSPVKLVK
jgi:uncharacterized small protein (DUF1192 family)